MTSDPFSLPQLLDINSPNLELLMLGPQPHTAEAASCKKCGSEAAAAGLSKVLKLSMHPCLRREVRATLGHLKNVFIESSTTFNRLRVDRGTQSSLSLRQPLQANKVCTPCDGTYKG